MNRIYVCRQTALLINLPVGNVEMIDVRYSICFKEFFHIFIKVLDKPMAWWVFWECKWSVLWLFYYKKKSYLERLPSWTDKKAIEQLKSRYQGIFEMTASKEYFLSLSNPKVFKMLIHSTTFQQRKRYLVTLYKSLKYSKEILIFNCIQSRLSS